MKTIRIFISLLLCLWLNATFAQNSTITNDNEEQERIAQSTAITTPTIMPANPTTTDSIKAKYDIYLASQPATQLSLTAVNVSGSVVTAQEHYGAGMQQLTTVVTKTSNIGKLPAGDYKFIYYAHKYYYTGNGTYAESSYIQKDSILFTVTGNPLSIAENGTDLLQHLSMRPNPAANQLIISSDKNINDLQIQIVNLTGNILLNTSCKSNCEIDISQLAQGLYFVNIYQREKFVGVKKLVVMR